jgi:polar amino acid transport system substrate-binding protein
MKWLIALMLIISTASPLAGQELNWAGDAEGGAPYVMPDPRNPAVMVGFEVDLANALAGRMGRQPRFVQNQWDGLVPGLERGEYNVVINGLEITPERAEKINFSVPYYYSTLTLTERIDETRIRTADDLRGKIVGTLKASFAERYLQNLGQITIRSYDGQANPYMDMSLGRLDAVVMDTPIATYYAFGPQYRNIELNSVRMMFGVGIRKADIALLSDVNNAIESLKRDGTLKRIYQDWGIYNAPTALAFSDPDPAVNGTAPRYNDYIDAIATERSLTDRLRQ